MKSPTLPHSAVFSPGLGLSIQFNVRLALLDVESLVLVLFFAMLSMLYGDVA